MRSYKNYSTINEYTFMKTSNQKFILPNDPVYSIKYTNMLQYPGGDRISDLENQTKDVILSDSFESKDTIPTRSVIDSHLKNSTCKTCK